MVNDGNIESPVIIVVLGICNVLPGTDNNYASFFQRKMYFVFFVFSLFLASKLVNILVFLGTNLILGKSLNLDISDLPNCYNVT